MCLALFLKSGVRVARAASTAGLCASGGALLLALSADLGALPMSRSAFAFMFLPIAVVVIASLVRLEADGGARVLRNSFLVRLGECSFALYMIHALVIRVVAFWLRLPMPGNMPLWAIAPVFASSLILAWAAHRYIEVPMERLLRARREPRVPVRSLLWRIPSVMRPPQGGGRLPSGD